MLVAGCNGILGVHDFEAPDAGALPADVTVHLFGDRFTGEAMNRDRQSIAPVRITLLDGTALPFQTLADGSVQTQVPAGATYQVHFAQTVLETDLPHVQLSAVFYGSANHPLPMKGTSARTNAMLGGGSMTASYRLMSTPTLGVALMTQASGGLTADWSTQIPLLADEDEFYLGAYVTSGAFASMNTYAKGSVTLPPGVTTDLDPLQLSVVTSKTPASMQFAFSALETRVRAIVPDATAVDPHVEVLAMRPELEHHATHVLAYDATPPTDAAVAFTYGNPFSSTTPVGMVQEIAYTDAHLVEQLRMTPLDDSGTATFTQDCGIPSAPTINGGLFSGASAEIDRDKPVRIAWSVDAPVQLAQVAVIDDAGATVFAGYTTRNEISVDPSLFVIAHTYLVQIFTTTGYPDGDFTTANPAIAIGAYRSDTVLIPN